MKQLKNILFNNRQLKNKSLELFWSIFRLLLLIALSFALLYPILYMISMAIRTPEDIYDVTVEWIPKHYTLENFKRMILVLDYIPSLIFTTLLSFVCASLSSIMGSLTGYGFARFKFKGRDILFIIVLLSIIVPATFYRMPSYIIYNEIGILNSPLTMVLPALLGSGIRSGLYIYLFRQFYKNFPKELEEAARIDGCNDFSAYIRIAVPTALPVFVTAFLFAFVWYWNDYQLSKLFIQDFNGIQTLSASIANLRNLIVAEFSQAAVDVDKQQFALDKQAASMLVIGPLLLLYIALQKFFVESVQRSGLAGD